MAKQTEAQRLAEFLDANRDGFTIREFCSALGYGRQLAMYDILPWLEWEAVAIYRRIVYRPSLLGGHNEEVGYCVWPTWRMQELI